MKKKKTDFTLSFFAVLTLTLILISGAVLLNEVFSIQGAIGSPAFSTSVSTDKVAAIVDPSPNATPFQKPIPSPSATPRPSPTPSPTPTPSPRATPKPAPSQTPTPTSTPKSSPTPSPSPKPSIPTATPTPTPDQTPVTPNPNTKIPNSEYGIDAYYWAALIAAVITIVVSGTAVIKKRQNK